MRIIPKVVRAYENTQQPEQCIVKIFEKYLAKHPSHDPKCSHDLYLRPLANPKNEHIWYSCQLIGVSTLAKVVAKLCDQAGMSGRFSNHSLRASTATRLYDKGVDIQQICELTGHCSMAVLNYKRTSSGQKVEISGILYGQEKKPSATMSALPPQQVPNVMEPIQNISPPAAPPQVPVTVDPVMPPNVNFTPGMVSVSNAQINIEQSPIVINLGKSTFQQSDGRIVLPPISVNLNINLM